MRPFDETLIDLALDIGYCMGQNNQSFKIDSREAVRQIYEFAKEFERWYEQSDDNYMSAIEDAVDVIYLRMLDEKTVAEKTI